LVILRFTICT